MKARVESGATPLTFTQELNQAVFVPRLVQLTDFNLHLRQMVGCWPVIGNINSLQKAEDLIALEYC